MKFFKVVSTKPPQPLSEKAVYMGRISAALAAIFAILQLAGISKSIENLNLQLSNESLAVAVMIFVLIAEVLSMPFLLRYKMSELARLLSGTLVLIAPWVWLLVSIWSIGGENINSAQLGVLSTVSAGWLILTFNALWLAFNFYVVSKLGIEKTWKKLSSLRSELKKSSK